MLHFRGFGWRGVRATGFHRTLRARRPVGVRFATALSGAAALRYTGRGIRMGHSPFLKLATLGLSVLMFGIALPAQVVFPETIFGPRLRTRVEPKYTKQALQAGIIGRVTVFVKVNKDGVPTEVRFLGWSGQNSEDPQGLDEAAVKAVRRWRFFPAIKWGKAEPFSASIEVEFDFHQHPEQLFDFHKHPKQLRRQPADRAVRI